MARSIHTVRRDLTEALVAHDADPERTKARVRSVQERLGTKSHVKSLVARERRGPPLPPGPCVDPESIPITVSDEGPTVHHPASPEDLRGVMARLPRGVLNGLRGIELSLGRHFQDPAEGDPGDPYVGRVGFEFLPGVFAPYKLGHYIIDDNLIRVFAYVYDEALPDRKMWECYMRLHVLATFVHEVAHHQDHTTRVSRGRWRTDETDRCEAYAETFEDWWMCECVVPYVQSRYPGEVAALTEWIAHHCGLPLPLHVLANVSPQVDTTKGRFRHDTPRLLQPFQVSDAIDLLLRSVSEGRSPTETRIDFADRLHMTEWYNPALAITDLVLLDQPDHLEALTLRADILHHLERYCEAREIAQAVLQRDDSLEKAWKVLAMVATSTHDWHEVVRTSTTLIEGYLPMTYSASSHLLARARAYIELGNLVLAQQDLDAVETLGLSFQKERAAKLRARMGPVKQDPHHTAVSPQALGS